MTSSQLYSQSNPFSTHRVRPGELAYRFGAGGGTADQDLASLIAKLRASRWVGQIVGPHGTGKSTLLQTLNGCWSEHGRSAINFTLHNGQRRLPNFDWRACDRNSQVNVDGFEQLSFLHRIRLRVLCHVRGFGLLITTHRPVAMAIPIVRTTSASRELVRKLAQETAGHPLQLDEKRIDECFVQANGNVRETFMLLYDVFENSR